MNNLTWLNKEQKANCGVETVENGDLYYREGNGKAILKWI